MDVDIKNRVTRNDLHTMTNLVEDTCSEAGCGMTILVDKHHKEQGHASQCMSCVMRAKLAKGEVK